MTVKADYVIPVSLEFLADAGIELTTMQQTWLDAQDAEREARWLALPRRTRFMRSHVYPRWHEARQRITHASDALRGISCEGNE